MENVTNTSHKRLRLVQFPPKLVSCAMRSQIYFPLRYVAIWGQRVLFNWDMTLIRMSGRVYWEPRTEKKLHSGEFLCWETRLELFYHFFYQIVSRDILQQIVYFRSSCIKDTSGKQTKITLKNFKTSSRQLTNLFGTASYPAVQRFVNHGFRVPKTSVGVRRWASKSLWHPSARKEDDVATICFVKPVVCQLPWIWAL